MPGDAFPRRSEYLGQWGEPDRCTTTSAGGEVRCPNPAIPDGEGLCGPCQKILDHRRQAAATNAEILRVALRAADPEWEG